MISLTSPEAVQRCFARHDGRLPGGDDLFDALNDASAGEHYQQWQAQALRDAFLTATGHAARDADELQTWVLRQPQP